MEGEAADNDVSDDGVVIKDVDCDATDNCVRDDRDDAIKDAEDDATDNEVAVVSVIHSQSL